MFSGAAIIVEDGPLVPDGKDIGAGAAPDTIKPIHDGGVHSTPGTAIIVWPNQAPSLPECVCCSAGGRYKASAKMSTVWGNLISALAPRRKQEAGGIQHASFSHHLYRTKSFVSNFYTLLLELYAAGTVRVKFARSSRLRPGVM